MSRRSSPLPASAAVVLALAVLTGCGTTAPPLTAPPVAVAGPVPPAPAGRTVVVDAGHNGGNATATRAIDRRVPDGRGGTAGCNTTGTETADGYAEHAFNWAVSQRLAAMLRERGVRVVLTRDADDGVGPCVDERGRAGERAGADAVVSVHADGGPPSGSGFHVLTSSPAVHPSQGAPSRALAADVVTSLRAGGFRSADYIGTDGLDPRAEIAGLNLATVPSVLVECANLRNDGDAATARSAVGRERYARAIADAVTGWLTGR